MNSNDRITGTMRDWVMSAWPEFAVFPCPIGRTMPSSFPSDGGVIMKIEIEYCGM